MPPPETDKLFRVIKETAVKAAGDRRGQKLAEFQSASQAGNPNFALIQRLAGELEQLDGLPEELASVIDPFSTILERRGIVLDLDVLISHRIPEEPEIMTVSSKDHHWRNPEKYVADAKVIILKKCLETDERGRFVYKSVREIALTFVKNKNDINDAMKYLHVEKTNFAKALRLKAAQTHSATVREALVERFGPNLEKARHAGWLEVYQTMIKHRGDLSPEEFTSRVINRFKFRPEAIKKIDKKVKPHDLSPKFLAEHPVAEVVLASMFLRQGTLDRIKGELLDGKNPDDAVAGDSILKKQLPLIYGLENSRDKICQAREYQQISREESKLAGRVIAQVMRRMAQDRRGWNKIPEDQVGFRLLYALIGKIAGDSHKIQKLETLLINPKIIVIDNDGSVISVKSI